MTSEKKPVAPAVPAATILLLRDGERGLEVFMVKRHHQIDFASGALVFPGGKLSPGDSDPRLRALCDGAEGMSDEMLAIAAAAIREAFEESGILLARRPGERDFIDAASLDPLDRHRAALNDSSLKLVDFLEGAGLRLAVDALVHFAQWITPTFMPKRFDTHFFVAATPVDQIGRHDGSESVDSTWIAPLDAISDPKRWTVIFPTRMNLIKLGEDATAEAAIARARITPVVAVQPWIEQTAEGPRLRIPPDAGYGDVSEPLEGIRG